MPHATKPSCCGDMMALRMDRCDPGRVPFMFAARQDRVHGLISGLLP
jgi:hypothetical protein